MSGNKGTNCIWVPSMELDVSIHAFLLETSITENNGGVSTCLGLKAALHGKVGPQDCA